jgi:hypothetical protein
MVGHGAGILDEELHARIRVYRGDIRKECEQIYAAERRW